MTGDEVRKAGFREKLRGYDPAVVDPLLDNIARALDTGLSISELLHEAHRRPFPMKWRGYHPADVDAFLDRLRSA